MCGVMTDILYLFSGFGDGGVSTAKVQEFTAPQSSNIPLPCDHNINPKES